MEPLDELRRMSIPMMNILEHSTKETGPISLALSTSYGEQPIIDVHWNESMQEEEQERQESQHGQQVEVKRGRGRPKGVKNRPVEELRRVRQMKEERKRIRILAKLAKTADIHDSPNSSKKNREKKTSSQRKKFMSYAQSVQLSQQLSSQQSSLAVPHQQAASFMEPPTWHPNMHSFASSNPLPTHPELIPTSVKSRDNDRSHIQNVVPRMMIPRVSKRGPPRGGDPKVTIEPHMRLCIFKNEKLDFYKHTNTRRDLLLKHVPKSDYTFCGGICLSLWSMNYKLYEVSASDDLIVIQNLFFVHSVTKMFGQSIDHDGNDICKSLSEATAMREIMISNEQKHSKRAQYQFEPNDLVPLSAEKKIRILSTVYEVMNAQLSLKEPLQSAESELQAIREYVYTAKEEHDDHMNRSMQKLVDSLAKHLSDLNVHVKENVMVPNWMIVDKVKICLQCPICCTSVFISDASDISDVESSKKYEGLLFLSHLKKCHDIGVDDLLKSNAKRKKVLSSMTQVIYYLQDLSFLQAFIYLFFDLEISSKKNEIVDPDDIHGMDNNEVDVIMSFVQNHPNLKGLPLECISDKIRHMQSCMKTYYHCSLMDHIHNTLFQPLRSMTSSLKNVHADILNDFCISHDVHDLDAFLDAISPASIVQKLNDESKDEGKEKKIWQPPNSWHDSLKSWQSANACKLMDCLSISSSAEAKIDIDELDALVDIVDVEIWNSIVLSLIVQIVMHWRITDYISTLPKEERARVTMVSLMVPHANPIFFQKMKTQEGRVFLYGIDENPNLNVQREVRNLHVGLMALEIYWMMFLRVGKCHESIVEKIFESLILSLF